ncbi:hypothetical protein [uncultured Tenacibaculum sp.]|uniref:hypothetical protein n=1 Tax=uncultured Tenacibaculum sp. TaxID=174713 RepID=UPI00261C436C|nr:hypothetical protein [uncultured Tenacibaculum sp.]
MKTLKLFNAVVAKDTTSEENPYISKDGFIIEKNALWVKERIIAYYEKERLSGNDLNKTFHKSWSKIKFSSRTQLYVDQIQHYISTYGSNFNSEVYIPIEVVDIPEVKLVYKVIKAYTVEGMTQKCLSLLQSGIALKEETVNDVISILVDELNYEFTGKENIKNKEATVKIADLYHVYPENVVEFFRYIIYRTTDSTLLIKNEELIDAIKNSSYNPTLAFNKYGLEKLAEIFNRFKPLFLAYKNRAPKVINKISKLSKKFHKPMVSNPLNEVTYSLLTEKDIHWLDNATPFALFKALNACYIRKNGQDTFLYSVRNGKSWVKSGNTSYASKMNYSFIVNYMKNRFDLSNAKIFLPDDVEYALPTSEKMYVENIPTGTKFFGKKMAVGIYWKNDWGARDLDLSGLNIGGKVGWNTSYKQGNGSLMYSGDITSAPSGAVEYLYAANGLKAPTLVNNNVYSGKVDCEYKIVIGQGDHISKDFMMNPNKLFAEIKCNSVQHQTILGMFLPESIEQKVFGISIKSEAKQSFVLLNFGAGHTRVSGNSEVSTLATKALYQQWSNPLSFKMIVELLGARIVKNKEEANHDFSLDLLEKDSFIKLFE